MTNFGLVHLQPSRFRIAILFAVCLASGVATCQTLPNTTAGDQLGELPYVSYHGGDIDVVSLTNGTLSLHAPLLSYPQRGKLAVSYSFRYNNLLQHYGPICTPPPSPSCDLEWTGPATLESVPEMSDVYVTFDQALGLWFSQPYPKTWQVGGQTYSDNYGDYYITTPDGGKHVLGNLGTASLVTWPAGGPNSYLVSTGPWETLDATGIKVTGTLAPISALNGSTRTITTPDGIQSNLQDPNGNYISSTSGGIIDTLGRSIPTPPLASSSSNTSTSVCPPGPLTVTKAVAWSTPAVNGATATYTFCYVTVTPNVPTEISYSGTMVFNGIGPTTNLQSVVLPNGTFWKFEYNDPDATQTYNGQPVTYGTLSKITLPTGGSISYTWTNAGKSLASQNSNVCNTGGRWVAARTVTDLGGTPHTWNYTYGLTFGSYPGTVVTDPLGNDTAHVFGLYNAKGGCGLYETQTLYYQGSHSSGTLQRTVNTTYQTSSSGNGFPSGLSGVVPASVTTVEANSQTMQTVKNYDSGFSYIDHFGNAGGTGIYGKVTSEQAYDYGSGAAGALLRTTDTSYAWQSPNPNYSSYLSNNLLNLPYSVQVKDGGGTQRAYSYYGYDESSLQSSGVTEQHGTGESHPGNQTSVHRWLNGSTTGTTNCAAVTTGYLVSTKVYYDTGAVQQGTDPCAYATTYQYSSTYYGAYLTTATNALSQNTNYAYDLDTGVLTSVTDPNSQVTSEQYDIMNRPTQINYPDGGQITACYTDMGGATCSLSGPPYSVVVTKAITASPVLNEISTLVYDGLGRLSQTQLNSDVPSTSYTQTTYDALGRKSQIYNPTRCSPPTTNCGTETTWGYTTNNYDALGRVTSVVEQDGSTVSTNYSAFPCTTVTDETGKARKSCVDGLGRMTGVWEDPSGLNYETDYTYDVLGDLTYINQKGSNVANARTRTFAYDSLSELTSATNPESSTIAYAYDADGNAITKTAPLPNQTGSSTVTTTSTYDKLNRLTGKSYKDGTVTDPYTPTVLFGYDATAPTGCTKNPPPLPDSYPVGRLTSMCDGSGATSWDHDPVGRVKQDARFIGSVTPSKLVEYGFTLNGSIQYVTTPPLKTVGYTYNGAGRAIQAVDSTDGINFVKNAIYAPPGGLTSMNMGSATGFAGFVTANAYNDRLQPILLSAASPSATVFSLCFDFHLAVAVNTSPCSFSASTAGDNGNINQIVNNRDNTRTENYTYDSLNRIASGYSSGTQWGETFTTDSWGNMTNENQIAGKTLHEGLNTSAGTNNQLAGFGYDAAGNMTSNGSASYIYDAENRLIWTSGYRYLYDGNGQRVEKCVAATVTTACPTSGTNGTLYWRGTGSDTLDETDLSGNALEEYVFFNGLRVARRDVSTNNMHYYFSDHLGSHAVVESATGTTCEQDIDYYPYGGVEHDYCPNVAQNYKFTGKERDAESGLDYFGARHHASALGRFMSADPKLITARHLGSPQKWNKYAYVQNNPLERFDPDGQDDWVVFRTAKAGPNADGKEVLAGTHTKEWSAAAKAITSQKDAKGNLNTFHMLEGPDATVKAYREAIAKPDTHVVFVGHGDVNPDNQHGVGIRLADGDSYGKTGSQYQASSQDPNVPPSMPNSTIELGGDPVAASSVALFGCETYDLAGEYSGTNFTGVQGELNTDTLDMAAIGYVTAGGGQPGVNAANTAIDNSLIRTDTGANVESDGPQ